MAQEKERLAKELAMKTSPLINNGFLPSSISTESTSSTIEKWNGLGLSNGVLRRKLANIEKPQF